MEVRDDRPAGAELLSQDRLQAQAIALAQSHRVVPAPSRGRPLLPRLDESATRLEEVYQFLSAAARAEGQAVASEDWLRDNYHVVQDQVREIRQDLPRKYYIELPKLAEGPSEGHPRVYVIAQALIGHTAGRLDLQTLIDFAVAYQRIAPLSIGEAWAIPIMLRLALLEELRRLADNIVSARRSRDQARRWGSLFANSPDDPAGVITRLLTEERQANGRLSAAFVVELLQCLRDQPSSAAPAWHVLHEALDRQGDSPETMLRMEHQREAADQLAIANVITSMRLMSSVDWTLFFEQVSVVERVLRDDPPGAYGRMDFATRDRYRHSVEELAKRARQPEHDVALRAVNLAREAVGNRPDNDRTHHVGYYLISRGRFRLEQDLRYPPTARERWSRFFFRHPALGYLGTLACMTVVSVASLVAYANRRGGSTGELWLVGLIVLLPAAELVISLVNLILTSQVPPRPLPKLDLRGGIPKEDRTFVVVPAIVDSESRLVSLLDDLEVRFLANRDTNLHFALLTDFADADERERSEDRALLAAASGRAQRAARSRSLLSVPPGASVEPVRRLLDGARAQARQARGIQRSAARRDRHQLHRPARRSASAPVGALRDHARFRHAVADGGRPASRGDAIASAQPAPVRSEPPAGQRGLRRASAAGVGERGQRDPHGVRRDLLRPHRPRPVHHGGVRPLSGSLPRGELRRQGDLRRRRVPRRAGRPRPREHTAQPRSVRRFLRADRLVYRHRGG
jgi:hypothetical protein